MNEFGATLRLDYEECERPQGLALSHWKMGEYELRNREESTGGAECFDQDSHVTDMVP